MISTAIIFGSLPKNEFVLIEKSVDIMCIHSDSCADRFFFKCVIQIRLHSDNFSVDPVKSLNRSV